MKQGWIQLPFLSLFALGALALSVFFAACGGGYFFSTSAQNPTPFIKSLSPTSAPTNSTAESITINGTGFLMTSKVTFNSVAHTPTFVSASQLTISLTAEDLAIVGNYPVVVTNPAPGGGSSASVTFGVWSTITDSVSSLTFGVPSLGAPPQVLYSGSSPYQLFALRIAAPNPHYNSAITPVITIFALSNPSKETIQQWFEDTVDDASGTLLASGTFQLQQLTNGPAMVCVGPIPATYQGGPVATAYMLAPSQDRVYGISQSQSAQLTEFGYASSSISGILTSILGGIH